MYLVHLKDHIKDRENRILKHLHDWLLNWVLLKVNLLYKEITIQLAPLYVMSVKSQQGAFNTTTSSVGSLRVTHLLVNLPFMWMHNKARRIIQQGERSGEREGARRRY